MKNQGYCHERIHHSPLEKAFAEQWEKENTPETGINFGNGILQDLFCEMHPQLGRHFASKVHEITDSERMVAATVVQWLGSNCGFSFLAEALNKGGFRIVRKDAK